MNLIQGISRAAGFGFAAALVVLVACSEFTGILLPDPPENVTATITTRSRITITWSPRPQRENVVAYSIYRGELKVGDSQTTSFVDSTAPEKLSHEYSVASHSASGVISERSSVVSVFAPDATPPRIVAVTPADGEVNVTASLVATVKFSEAMNAASINASTITVKDATSGTAYPGLVTYDDLTRTALWTATPALPAERRVTMFVSTDVKDASGNQLSATHAFAFTTRELGAPFVVSFTPANGSVVPVGTLPTVRFSERIRFPGPFGATEGVRMIDRTGQYPDVVGSALTYDTLTNVVTLRHQERVRSFHLYTIEVNDNVMDLAGNRVAPLNFTLQFGEWALPAIASVSPGEGATNVSLSAPITVDLATPMMPVNDYEPRLEARVTTSGQSVGSVMSYVLSGGTRTTLSAGGRTPNTQYTATFYHFFTDSKGVRQEATKQWTFTRGS